MLKTLTRFLGIQAVALGLAFCAIFSAPASAAGRDDVFAVQGVIVDVTAPDATQARDLGFAQAQKTAYDRLVRRLVGTVEAARAPALAGPQLDRLIAGVDIEQERRSGTRYIARLTVNFDPVGVRETLEGAGLTLAETRAAPVLVVPQMVGATPAADTWRQAWEQGGYGGEIAPIAVAPPGVVGEPDWAQAQMAAAAAGATSAIYATAQVNGPNVNVALMEVGPNGLKRNRGSASAPLADTSQLPVVMRALADRVNQSIQDEWRIRVAAAPPARARVSASALYANEAEWTQIKHALERAAATIVSDIRIEAVAKQGALISFSYIGAPDQLRAELRRSGILMETGPSGPVLRPATA